MLENKEICDIVSNINYVIDVSLCDKFNDFIEFSILKSDFLLRVLSENSEKEIIKGDNSKEYDLGELSLSENIRVREYLRI